MFCPKCGTKNADSAKFCFSCGNPMPTFAPIEKVEEPVEASVEAPAPAPAEPVVEPVVEPEEEKTMLFVPGKSVDSEMDATMAFTPVAPVEPVKPIAPVAPIYTPPVAPTYSNFEPVEEPVSAPAPAPQMPNKKSNKGLIIAIVAIVVVIAAAIGVCIGMGVFDGDKKEKTEETTKEKTSESTTEEQKEEESEPTVQYNYKTVTINGNPYAIAFDAKNRVIFEKECAVYYTFDDQGQIVVDENGEAVKNLLNYELTGGEYNGIVVDGVMYCSVFSCKIPQGWEYDDGNMSFVTTDPNIAQSITFMTYNGYNGVIDFDQAFNEFVEYMEQATSSTAEITENITLPGTSYKAKKGACVSMLDGKAEAITEFYVFETNTGVYCFILDADPSHMDENFDFDTFIRTNITVY